MYFEQDLQQSGAFAISKYYTVTGFVVSLPDNFHILQ